MRGLFHDRAMFFHANEKNRQILAHTPVGQTRVWAGRPLPSRQQPGPFLWCSGDGEAFIHNLSTPAPSG